MNSKLEKAKKRLEEKKATLVVYYANGEIKEYYQKRIIAIKEILNKDPLALKGAVIADRVIGKVAASILIVAGVSQIYAEVISKLAIPLLEENSIPFECKEEVDYIKNQDNTGMCPMEKKYQKEQDIQKIYQEIFQK